MTARGDPLWLARHRALLGLLWVHVLLIVPWALVRHHPARHALLAAAAMAGLAVAGGLLRRRMLRASAVSLGLMLASSLVVHLGGGLTVLHFHFFFIVAALALYQSALPYCLALAATLIDHGLMVAIAPREVFDDAFGLRHPVAAVAVHGGYVLLAAAANVVAWRWSESERMDAERRAELEAARVRDSERRLSALYDLAPMGMYVKDTDRRLTRVNRLLLAWEGRREQDVLGRRAEDVAGALPAQALVAEDDRVLAGEVVEREQVLHVAQSERSFHTVTFPLRDDAGNVTGIAGIMADITGRRRAEQQLRDSEARLREVFERGPVPQAILNLQGEVVQANAALGALLDRPVAELAGRSLAEFAWGSDADTVRSLLDRLTWQDRADGELRMQRRDGAQLHCQVCLAPVRQGERETQIVGTLQDVTAERRATAALERQATGDALTGLANRALLTRRLEGALADPERPVTVAFLDLDGFKDVNDSLGHDVGDALLQAVSGRLAAQARHGDTLARLGGDEFVLCCPGLQEDGAVQALGERLLAALSDPVRLPGRVVTVRASVGLAVGRAGAGATAGTLLRDADTALYEAKRAGRGRCARFRPALREREERRRRLEESLADALAGRAGGLHLAYQPVALAGGGVTGVEALLRWQAPQGPVAPLELLQVASGAGLLPDLDRWVVERAVRDAADWGADGQQLSVGVNISGTSVADGALVADVARICADHGVAPTRLWLEVTETTAIQEREAAGEVLARLRRLGVTVALDDFGTGYSSLSHLRDLPVDVVKVDRSFTRDITTSARDASLVRATVALARALGATVVAEGVENEAQRAALVAAGCDLLQGWLVGWPVPADRVPGLAGTPGVPLPRAGEQVAAS